MIDTEVEQFKCAAILLAVFAVALIGWWIS